MPLRKVSALVIDDDVHMVRMMRRILELEGCTVLTASSGEAALEVFDEQVPDVVLLDIMMQGMDGYSVCQRIREFSQVPIITVSAKNGDQDKVKMLGTGADDYITKPFSSQELMARIKAVLRRTNLQAYTQPLFHANELTIDFARQSVSLQGQEINLTATEYSLLCYLALNAGRIVTIDQILEKVWGEEYTGDNHLLRVNIARLRSKLGDGGKKHTYIITRPGMGYVMKKE